ncbi:LysR family transcriptional regulator, partial [Patulibacter medicamentivorans]|uniref:LysR family transcriptional regulator n=1 Tax=Patulibacter medicamentivorans TaxID=1097667 RepID=UPI0006815122
MELRQLQYFAAVARHRHVTRAAEALHVTQPALSQQIRRLERELGVALLHRMPKGVEPTAAGEELLARAERILAEVAGVRAEMDAHAGAVRGVVRVAAPAGEADDLPAALAAFGAEHPGIGLALRHAAAAEAVELLRHGTVDLAVVATTPDAAVPAGLASTVLRDEPLRLLVAAEDPLGAAERIALWDVRDRPFVLAQEGSALRELAMAACAEAGFGPVPRFAIGDPATVRHLVAAGLGVALVPRSWAGEGVAVVAPTAPAG